MKNLKVAMIEPVGGHGGMDYYDFGLCSGLASVGVDVTLHTCDETELSPSFEFTVRHTYHKIFGKSHIALRGIRFVTGSIKALCLAVLENRKIVHFHFFHVGLLALMNVLLARILVRKIMITAHDVESFVSSQEVPFMSRTAYRLAHKIIAHNQISKNELIAKLNVAEEKIVIIPHGNYLHCLLPSPSVETARVKLDIPKNAKVLLFFGHIRETKGLDILLNSLPAILKSHPDAVLVIAGKPWKTNFSNYLESINKLNISQACITRIKHIDNDEVPLYYDSADLIVLPYRRIYQSGVVLMAMSYGKAVVVSDLPGMLEIVEHQKSGFVFKSENIEDLANTIIKALDNNSLIDVISKNGFNLMKNKYDWHKIGLSTKEAYTELQNIH